MVLAGSISSGRLPLIQGWIWLDVADAANPIPFPHTTAPTEEVAFHIRMEQRLAGDKELIAIEPDTVRQQNFQLRSGHLRTKSAIFFRALARPEDLFHRLTVQLIGVHTRTTLRISRSS